MTVRRRFSISLLALLLAGCGDQPANPPEATAPEEAAPEAAVSEAPPPALSEPPVAREPEIPPPSAHIALNPGTYRADDVALSLSALRFELEAPDQDVAAEGTYEVINSVLSLSATAGDTGDATFPIECLLSRRGPSILFADFEDGSCGFLDGMLFQRDTRPG